MEEKECPKSELSARVFCIVKKERIDPSERHINEVVTYGMLSQYGHKAAIQAAYDNGFKLTQCCVCHKIYSYGGKWIDVGRDLAAELASYEKIEHTFSPDCEQKFRRRWGLLER